MRTRELKEKTENELHSLLKEKREKMRQMRFDLINKQLKNPRQIREIKKDIARILTLLR